jgi:hypothetical protein
MEYEISPPTRSVPDHQPHPLTPGSASGTFADPCSADKIKRPILPPTER